MSVSKTDQSKKRRERMQVSPEKIQKNITRSVVIVLVVIVGLVAFAYLRPKTLGFLNKTTIARIGNVEKTISTTAIIVRDERLVVAPVGGKISFLVNEYEKLSLNTEVAKIVDEPILESMIPITQSKREEIQRYLQTKNFELTQANELLIEVRVQIATKESQIETYQKNQDAKSVNRLQSELADLKTREIDLLQEISQIDSDMYEAQQELNASDRASSNTIGNVLEVLKIKTSAIISRSYDGLEETLNPNSKDILDFEMNSSNYTLSTIKDGDIVTTGQPVFREIQNYKTFILMKVTLQNEKLSVGSKVGVRFPDLATEAVDGSVYKMKCVNEDKQTYSILVELDRFPTTLVDLRYRKAQFIVKNYFGIIVPASAVMVDKDGFSKVKILKGNKFEFREVKVVGGNEKELVVTGISDGDKVMSVLN